MEPAERITIDPARRGSRPSVRDLRIREFVAVEGAALLELG